MPFAVNFEQWVVESVFGVYFFGRWTVGWEFDKGVVCVCLFNPFCAVFSFAWDISVRRLFRPAQRAVPSGVGGGGGFGGFGGFGICGEEKQKRLQEGTVVRLRVQCSVGQRIKEDG